MFKTKVALPEQAKGQSGFEAVSNVIGNTQNC
jgi:hypothetical protein